MSQANIQYLPQWRAAGNTGDLPTGWTPNGAPGGASTNPLSNYTDPIETAKKVQQMQIDANQPAIAQLQKSSTDLQGTYKDLLESIKGQQGVAQDAQTLATNNELGRRGISSDSGVAQQQQASALRPIAAQYQGLAANAGIQQQNDLSGIAGQIAQLQGGNLPSALQFGQGASSLAQQAQQIAQNYALQQKQAQYIPLGYGGLYDSSTGQTIDSNAYKSIGAGGLYDPNTGQVIQGQKAAPASQLNNNGGF